jgi:hypothetical protein
MLLPLALMLSLGAAPAGAVCVGERLVLVPFDSVALPRSEGRQTEEAVRRAVARTPGICLEPRKETVERLLAQGGKQRACADEACRAQELKAYGTKWLLHGRVLGLGGQRTVALTLVGADGHEARSTFAVPTLEAGAEEAAAKAFGSLWQGRGPSHPPKSEEEKTLSPLPMVLLGAGAAALVAGVGFGMAARSTEKRFSTGNGGCEGEGDTFRQCFAEGLRRGERQSLAANGLLGAGALLGAGGTLVLVWELP